MRKGGLFSELSTPLNATFVDDRTLSVPRAEVADLTRCMNKLGIRLYAVNELVEINRANGKEQTMIHVRAERHDDEPDAGQDRGLTPRISWGPARRYHDA
jgi:hypothetical protein